MPQLFYVTTPIYYVNDVPHLGHAYTTLIADTLARFHRMCDDDVHFLTGTDEHGQKIAQAAKGRGLTPQAFCDLISPRFKQAWIDLGLPFGEDARKDGFSRDFIRTTEDRHKRVAQKFWEKIQLLNPDDIYLAPYEGWYCVDCEMFYPEAQLRRLGNTFVCATHEKTVAWIEKEYCYFFRLSKYTDALVEHINNYPEFIQPAQFRNEILALLRDGLHDISISRTNISWGIPVPNDPQHVMYVWFDALTNYLSALGDPFEWSHLSKTIEGYFSNAVHVVGKDIVRFHAVYWPAFLLAAGLPLPQTILCHGWWQVDGRKISKSIPTTKVSATRIATDLNALSQIPGTGSDALRYFLLRETPFGNDGDFSFEKFIDRYNSDLANDLGNLISRSFHLLARFGAGRFQYAKGLIKTHDDFAQVANEINRAVHGFYLKFEFSRALEEIWHFIREANAYIAATEPWKLARDSSKKDALDHVLNNIGNALWHLQFMLAPALPTTAQMIGEWLGEPRQTLRWQPAGFFGGYTPPNPKVPQPLFPRIDRAQRQQLLAGWLQGG